VAEYLGAEERSGVVELTNQVLGPADELAHTL
jgi:hypothetical protein